MIRKLRAPVLAASVLVAAACGRPPQASAPAGGALEAEALKAVAQYDRAWQDKDVPAAERVLAPSYVYFTSRGDVTDRAKALATLSSPGYRIEKGVRSGLHAYRHGTTVVVGSRWIAAGVFDGKPFADDQRCSVVVGFADGVARVLSEHCTNVPAP